MKASLETGPDVSCLCTFANKPQTPHLCFSEAIRKSLGSGQAIFDTLFTVSKFVWVEAGNDAVIYVSQTSN